MNYLSARSTFDQAKIFDEVAITIVNFDAFDPSTIKEFLGDLGVTDRLVDAAMSYSQGLDKGWLGRGFCIDCGPATTLFDKCFKPCAPPSAILIHAHDVDQVVERISGQPPIDLTRVEGCDLVRNAEESDVNY